jgi:hypothetical protein
MCMARSLLDPSCAQDWLIATHLLAMLAIATAQQASAVGARSCRLVPRCFLQHISISSSWLAAVQHAAAVQLHPDCDPSSTQEYSTSQQVAAGTSIMISLHHHPASPSSCSQHHQQRPSSSPALHLGELLLLRLRQLLARLALLQQCLALPHLLAGVLDLLVDDYTRVGGVCCWGCCCCCCCLRW